MPRWHTTIQNPSPCERNKGNRQNTKAQWCGGKIEITCEPIPTIFPQIHSLGVVAGWAYMETESKYKP